MESWWFQLSSHFFYTSGSRTALKHLCVVFTWLNGSLCINAISFCTILMTEQICWYKPFWIRRGESCQKLYLEEWENVDVAQCHVSGDDKSCPTATVTEIEGVQKAQEDERTSSREPHRGDCSFPKLSWEAVGTFEAPSWRYTGTQENSLSWGSLGAQPPSKTRARHFIHQSQYGAFPTRIVLPYPFGEMLSGYEEDVSSIRMVLRPG